MRGSEVRVPGARGTGVFERRHGRRAAREEVPRQASHRGASGSAEATDDSLVTRQLMPASLVSWRFFPPLPPSHVPLGDDLFRGGGGGEC